MKNSLLKNILVIGTLFATWVLLSGAPVSAADSLEYYASNQVYKAFGKENIEAFVKATGIKVELKTASSSSCTYALMNGNCDIASTARALYRKHRDYGYQQTPFCIDPIAVIVNAKCGVDNLTEKQLQDVFSGDITNWREVGGPDLPISIVVPSRDTAANKNFRRQVMKHKDMVHDFMSYSSTGVIEAVKNFPCGTVSFTSRGAAEYDKGIKIVKIDGKSPSDKGYPYYQIFYYITKGEPMEAVRKSMDFSFSTEGKKIIRDHGMVPIER